jgi:DNA polymerase-3 subunit alpha
MGIKKALVTCDKKNPVKVKYLHPDLKPILEETYGVLVYQEQVMAIANQIAGYTMSEADGFRMAMGKKKKSLMKKEKEKFTKQAIDKGHSKALVDKLFAFIEKFAAYGFNKPHSVSYALIAYWTAYMKANYPVAYMTAIMTNESGDVERIAEIVSECRRMNITVLPPNVNFSDGGFSIVENKDGVEEIRFGLHTIKNLGVDIGNAIIEERKAGGRFTSFEDFIRRVTHKNLNKKSLEALTMCGALDELGERGQILANMESILEYHKHVVRDNSLQNTLFGNTGGASFVMKKSPPISKDQRLVWEKELLGLFVSGFPLDPWKEKISERKLSIQSVLHSKEDSKKISLAVIIETIRLTKTKKGDTMALLKLRDYDGTIEVAVFPETYARYKSLIALDKPLIVEGHTATRNNEKTMIINDIKPLLEKQDSGLLVA